MKKTIAFSWAFATALLMQSCQQKSTEEVANADGYSGATKSASNNKANSNEHWWPNQLNLEILRQNSSLSDPMNANYRDRKSVV